MNYLLFQKAAALNSEFEVIPEKIKVLAMGANIDDNGYILYKGGTYVTNMVKLKDMPVKLQQIFKEPGTEVQTSSSQVQQVQKPKNSSFGKLDKLNNILFEQLENLVDPEDADSIEQELKKAAAVCNIADKIVGIADLSLKAEKFYADNAIAVQRNIYG